MRITIMKVTCIAAMLAGAISSPAAAVTAGEPDSGRHPNVGALLVAFGESGLIPLCSGSLIAPEEFLTAGHCTEFLEIMEPTRTVVSFDEDLNLDAAEGTAAPATTIPVAGSTTMPGFHGTAAKAFNDLGVVHFAQPVVGIGPVQLPAAGFLDAAATAGGLTGHVFTNVGYGRNAIDRSFSSPNVTVTWEGRRMVSTTRFKSLTPTYLKQQGGNCRGDSGGPHFWTSDGPLSNLAVAVTSASDATCGNLAENQRLDTPEAVEFLAPFAR